MDDGTLRQWDSNARTRRFRKDLTFWLAKKQKGRCSYCSLQTGAVGHRGRSLDHLVPKSAVNGVPEWSFEIENLILSCDYCNTKLKKRYNPLVSRGASYRSSSFAIYHPYLDRAGDHITGGYRGGADEPSTPTHRSEKGRKTIELFRLTSVDLRELWHQEYRSAVERRERLSWRPSRRVQFMDAARELGTSKILE
ncbi:HNH endonuclease [Microbacterium sp. NPDC008134]|uniref:HNH endonuclease n=1 Tax=Microbacterium sp. NPDC008134 TaxID=3364183 RepID=UPI0036EC509E